jgi:integrase
VSRRDGYIRKGRNGRYYAEVERTPDPITENRRRLALGGFDTTDEASRAIRKALDRLDRGWDDAGRVTLAQHLEGWLADVELDLSPTTASLYRTIVRAYVLPRIGAEKLKAVTPVMLTRLYADLLASGGRGGRPLGPRTVRNVHRTLRTALESAVDARRLDWNPAASKATKIPRLPRPEIEVWTPAELGRFLDEVRGDRLAALYIVAAVTGMRRGELLGLRWRDVDLEERTLKIRRTIVQLLPVGLERGGAEVRLVSADRTAARRGRRIARSSTFA